MIFDAHTHVYPAALSPGFWRKPSGVEELMQAMDSAGVSRAAVLAIAPPIPSQAVCDMVALAPERLVAVGSVDPRNDDALKELDHAVRTLGVRAIKLHPRIQKIGLGDLHRVTLVAQRCADLGVPLIICSFLGGQDMFRSRTLELCNELAGVSPETTIILAHAGGYRPLDAFMILKANANIHVDLSFSPLYFAGSSVQQDLEYLVRKADPQRVLFGSDFPETSLQASVDWALDLVERLALKPAHREAILHDNAVRLFKV